MHSQDRADLVIIGAGPAGMTAAIEARRAGVGSVVVLDDNHAPGGQIFRRYGPGVQVFNPHEAGEEYTEGQELIDEFLACGATVRSRTTAWGMWDRRVAYAEDGVRSGDIEAQNVILATGARDRAFAFPGWTLPGVITAGAAKTMVAIHRVLPGRRILMAGSGPLALAFSAQLHEYGAHIVEVAEAAPAPGWMTLGRLALKGETRTMMSAARYRLGLMRAGIRLAYSTIIVSAEGRERVERVTLAKVDRDWRVVPGSYRQVEVDTLVLGYGLESSSELSRLIGCRQHFDRRLGGWIPTRDADLRTSVAGVFAAGDGAGVGGSRFALTEGRIAGIMAARELGKLTPEEAERRAGGHRRRLRGLSRFRAELNDAYAVGDGLYELAQPDTPICRCEERTLNDLHALIAGGIDDPNIVRARSRIGMGRCQGRNCASSVAATISTRLGRPLEAVPPLSVRAPVRPILLSAIAEERVQHEAEVEVR